MNNIKQVIKNASEKITLDNMNEMFNCLKNINDKSKQNKCLEDLKELIQLIIDYLIYGDKKKDQTFFENFCELDFMHQFIVVSKKSSIEILLQIIKSLSALILTITNKASLFYFFSNNFINNIITNDSVQESNDDFLSFYINFLKSLSLKIDVTTIELFFHKEKNSFPLLENALKLYNNDDSMVKNVVRNIFLKFAGLSKTYLPLKEYLMSVPILRYYCFLACRLNAMTLRLDHMAGYNFLYKYNSQQLSFDYEELKSLHDDLIDEILYFNDLLSLNDTKISNAVLNALLYYYICPLLFGSIYQYKYIFKIGPNQVQNRNVLYIISVELALYILSLLMSNIHNDSLLNILCYLLYKRKISSAIVTGFIDIHFNNRHPLYPHLFYYNYKEQIEKIKNLNFAQYIAFNYDKKFICNLITKPNPKYPEVNQLHKKYTKFFDDSEFDPLNNYEKIFKDVYNKLEFSQKKFVRNYHNILSVATGVKCGLSENEHLSNVINSLNIKIDMIDNPIRKIIFEILPKYKFEIINFQINILLYSTFYNIMNDHSKENNKSISRKFLYRECSLLPYDIFIHKQMINKNFKRKKKKENIIKEEENEENIINTNEKNDKKNENKIEEEENEIDEGEYEEEPLSLNPENIFLYKTENFEIIFSNLNDYKEEFVPDNKVIDAIIDMIIISNSYCSLELLLMIHNLRYLTTQINNTEDSKEKSCVLTEEQITKLSKSAATFIQRAKSLLKDNSNKSKMFQMLEQSWHLYTKDYSFNQKNLITKYILTPYYFCIPSTMEKIEEFPFHPKNLEIIYILGFFALDDLIKNKLTEKFPLDDGFFEYKVDDEVDMDKIEVNDDKFSIIKASIKPEKRSQYEDGILFLNKNCVIFGIEEEKKLKIKKIYPIRELEVCSDKTDSLKLYFKEQNYSVKFETEEKANEVKTELEKRRNDYITSEAESSVKFWDEKEEEYKKLSE